MWVNLMNVGKFDGCRLYTGLRLDYQSWVSAGRNLFLPDIRFKPD